LIVNAAVPARGPCSDENPVTTYDRLPTTITTAACQKRSPNDMISAPYTTYSTLNSAPVHIHARSIGDPRRCATGM
jgi:hypothetical protein